MKLLRYLPLLLLCFCTAAIAEPQLLNECKTKEEAALFIDFPDTSGETPRAVTVTAGRIRFIPQSQRDELFVLDYWLGGPEGSDLDLTLQKDSDGDPYEEYCGTMCTRAVYSMILSYYGIDLSPGAISAMLGLRSVDMPYDEITDHFRHLERVHGVDYRELDNMLERYLSDASYSPILVTLLRPNGTSHALLVVGMDDDGRLICIDPAPYELKGVVQRVQFIRPTYDRQRVYSCTIESYQDALISGCYQWHWIES